MNTATPSSTNFLAPRPGGFEPSATKPSFGNTNSSLNNSWGSLEQAINQAVNPGTKPASVSESKSQGSFAIGETHQTFMVFGPKIEKQIETVQNVLHQISEQNHKDTQSVEEVIVAPKKIIDTEQVIEGAYNQVEKVSKTTYKQGRDVFDAIKDLWFGDIGFRHLTPEQKRKQDDEKAKLQAQNENKRSFFASLNSAKTALENMMMKMLNELSERLGISGKSIEEKNKLLGVKGRNFSYRGVDSAYHIKAIHDALIEQAAQQKLQQSKAAAPTNGKKKTNYFMDKNSALSRQGQNVYSAAG